MMNKRYVLDANIIISAFLLRASLPRQAFDAAFAQGTVLVSEQTIGELTDVLQRSRFDRYIIAVFQSLRPAIIWRHRSSSAAEQFAEANVTL